MKKTHPFFEGYTWQLKGFLEQYLSISLVDPQESFQYKYLTTV